MSGAAGTNQLFSTLILRRTPTRINFASFSINTWRTAFQNQSLPTSTLNTQMKRWMRFMDYRSRGGISLMLVIWRRQIRRFNLRFGSWWQLRWITYTPFRRLLTWVLSLPCSLHLPFVYCQQPKFLIFHHWLISCCFNVARELMRVDDNVSRLRFSIDSASRRPRRLHTFIENLDYREFPICEQHVFLINL